MVLYVTSSCPPASNLIPNSPPEPPALNVSYMLSIFLSPEEVIESNPPL